MKSSISFKYEANLAQLHSWRIYAAFKAVPFSYALYMGSTHLTTATHMSKLSINDSTTALRAFLRALNKIHAAQTILRSSNCAYSR